MSFNGWVNRLFGYEDGIGIDMCDMSDEEVAELYEQYNEEMLNAAHID